jgi:succinate dehydrogenase flavin-adding protein (antitoxin of CptAB toxin-antitoxin module)
MALHDPVRDHHLGGRISLLAQDPSSSPDVSLHNHRRCWHRGTQNSDLILGNFSEAHLSRFDSARLHRIEALLDCSDPGPFDRIIGGFAPSKEYDHDVMHLRGFAAWCGSFALVAGGELFSPTRFFIASPIGMLLLFLWSVGLIDVASLSTDV